MDTKPYEQQIDEIMDCFDFGKVHEVMKALKWRWCTVDGIPDEATIRMSARQMLRDIVKGNNTYESCGGFEATNEDGCLELKFVVDYWRGDDA